MRVQFDVAKSLSGGGVNNSQRAVAVADVNALRGAIVADVIRIVGENRRTVFAVRYEDLVEFRNIGHTLRLVQAADRLKPFARAQVEDLQSIVAERRNKQPLAFRVDGEVINPAFDAGQRDRLD